MTTPTELETIAERLWGVGAPAGEWSPSDRAPRAPADIAPSLDAPADGELLRQCEATLGRMLDAVEALATSEALHAVQLREIDDTIKRCERVRARVNARLRRSH